MIKRFSKTERIETSEVGNLTAVSEDSPKRMEKFF
jgi:hypothetical protein